MSENELTTTESQPLVDLSEAPVASYYNDEEFEKLSSSSFILRLQLFGANSDLVKEEKVPMASYGIPDGDSVRVLGKKINVIPLALRLIAIRFSDPDNEGKVISYYNPESPEFKQIIADSEDPNSGCMYGPQFLLYIPAIREFATFLFGTKSSRKEARNMRPLLGRGATLHSKLIKGQKFSWHVPVVVPCSEGLDIPPRERMLQLIEQFNNTGESSIDFSPPEDEEEEVEEGERVR